MKLPILASLAAVALTGCGTLGTGANSDWASAALEIAKDPACTHTDVLDIMLGPVPSGHVHLERSGCKSTAPAKASVAKADALPADPGPSK